MKKFQRIALLFPGQGAQYVGMGRDFFSEFAEARRIFEEADDLLRMRLSSIAFEGPIEKLTETENSQRAIYVMSLALLAVVEHQLGPLAPYVCAGLSLGEYSALTAGGYFSFAEGLDLVDKRARFMQEACKKTAGKMAVILGLDGEAVEAMVEKIALPDDLWVANLNCPGQVVISGTTKGIEAATNVAKIHGAKRVVPLQVHGAFHSGLMQSAQESLAPYIEKVPLQIGPAALVMNVPGDFVDKEQEIRDNLKKQVTAPVRWEQGIRSMAEKGVDLFIEIGCGKTLAGMNKRIGVTAPTVSVDAVSDIHTLEKIEKEEA